MPGIDQASFATIQPELISGESILWAGQPSTSVIFHREDFLLIPFSLFWGGFALFWEAGVSGVGPFGAKGAWSFGMLWGVPFVLAGQYLIWGRFLYAAWLKKRTYYAVTNRRVITVQNGWSRKMASSYIDALPSIIKEKSTGTVGSLRFSPAQPIWGANRARNPWNSMSVGDSPVLVDVEDSDFVYRLVSDLREKARTTTVTS